MITLKAVKDTVQHTVKCCIVKTLCTVYRITVMQVLWKGVPETGGWQKAWGPHSVKMGRRFSKLKSRGGAEPLRGSADVEKFINAGKLYRALKVKSRSLKVLQYLTWNQNILPVEGCGKVSGECHSEWKWWRRTSVFSLLILRKLYVTRFFSLTSSWQTEMEVGGIGKWGEGKDL